MCQLLHFLYLGNRSYVKNLLGDYKSSKKDYDTAQQKVREYREKSMADSESFADTTKKYSALLSLDAEFAKKDFNDELLQNRDIDVKLRPLYKFVLSGEKDMVNYALSRGYENPLVTRLETELPVGIKVVNEPIALADEQLLQTQMYAWDGNDPQRLFVRALYENDLKRFNSALAYYSGAIEAVQEGEYGVNGLYNAFYYMNRGALRAEMIDFLASIDNNVQVLSMDDTGAARARVKDRVVRQYDYSEAIEDMKAAADIVPNIPYVYFNLGNLYCLSEEHLASIENYTKAIDLYPYMGDAYFNRGLVLIYLKDKEKGCIDLSRAGELGVADAYGIIKKYCEENND